MLSCQEGKRKHFMDSNHKTKLLCGIHHHEHRKKAYQGASCDTLSSLKITHFIKKKRNSF